MADATATPAPGPVSILTTHITSKGAELVVTGKHGSLAIRFSTEGPSIDFPDWERGEEKYKAVCELAANGEVKGWFVEKKGAPADDTLVFFPKMQRLVPASPAVTVPEKKQPSRSSRTVKKGGRR